MDAQTNGESEPAKKTIVGASTRKLSDRFPSNFMNKKIHHKGIIGKKFSEEIYQVTFT